MADPVKVHLARPGGEREGPFTVLEINQALATEHYQISDYWAWHEGLAEWVPLYAIEGISKQPLPSSSPEPAERAIKRSANDECSNKSFRTRDYESAGLCEPDQRGGDELRPMTAGPHMTEESDTATVRPAQASSEEAAPAVLEPSPALRLTAPATVPESDSRVEPTLRTHHDAEEQAPRQSAFEGSASPDSAAAEEEPPHPEKALFSRRFYSGMPLEALEQLFVFTTGDGPSVWESSRVCRMLEAITGAPLAQIRQSTRRDVMFNCQGSQLLKLNGAISQEAWRAMAIRAPKVVEAAQAKLCRTCVCSFPTEQNHIVALVLFYRADSSESPEAGELACAELASRPG